MRLGGPDGHTASPGGEVMSRALRVVLPVVVGVQALFAVAFALQVPAAVRLWPLPYADWLSFTFVASLRSPIQGR